LLWSAIHGRAARSSRTCTGRVAARIAAVNGIRVPGAGVAGRGRCSDGLGRAAVERAAGAGSAGLDGSTIPSLLAVLRSAVPTTCFGAGGPLGAGHGVSWFVRWVSGRGCSAS
jgi:hypothetical protein